MTRQRLQFQGSAVSLYARDQWRVLSARASRAKRRPSSRSIPRGARRKGGRATPSSRMRSPASAGTASCPWTIPKDKGTHALNLFGLREAFLHSVHHGPTECPGQNASFGHVTTLGPESPSRERFCRTAPRGSPRPPTGRQIPLERACPARPARRTRSLAQTSPSRDSCYGTLRPWKRPKAILSERIERAPALQPPTHCRDTSEGLSSIP